MKLVIYFSKLERCEVIIKARSTHVIRYLAIVALCLLLGFMLGRKSKYEKRDYLKQFKIGKELSEAGAEHHRVSTNVDPATDCC